MLRTNFGVLNPSMEVKSFVGVRQPFTQQLHNSSMLFVGIRAKEIRKISLPERRNLLEERTGQET